MTEKTCKTVRLAYGWVLSAMTVITGVLFIWQTLDIYITGTAPGYTGTFIFTRERVAERIATIAPAFWLWIAMIAAGFIVWEVFPVNQKRGAYGDPRYALARMKKRLPASVGDELADKYAFVRREEKILKILWLCCAVFGLVAAIYSIVYLAIPSHFPKENVTEEVLAMVKNIFPFVFVLFALCCGAAVYEGISAKKQIPYVRQLVAGAKAQEAVHGKIYNILHHKYCLLTVRVTLGCIAVAFIIAGACTGNMDAILKKAINICTECIGLG